MAEFGSLDIPVNNAGIIRRAPAADYSPENWDDVISIDLTAVFRLTQLAARQMFKQATPGKILNIASVLSFQGGILVPAYAAAKGGVVQLTRAFANEWAAKVINVNSIARCYIITDNIIVICDESFAAARFSRARRTCRPLGSGRFPLFRGLRYVHGHVLVVDGGWLSR